MQQPLLATLRQKNYSKNAYQIYFLKHSHNMLITRSGLKMYFRDELGTIASKDSKSTLVCTIHFNISLFDQLSGLRN